MARPESARIGIIGVQLLDGNDEIARRCARFPTTRHFITKMLGLTRLFPRVFPEHFHVDRDHRRSRPIEQVMGAYFFLRGAVFRELGSFDERFFVYFEDVDLSLRALNAGRSTYYLASAQCGHVGGGSTDQVKGRRLFYSLHSRIFYAFKHFGTARVTALLLATLCLEPIPRIGRAVLQRSMTRFHEILQGYLLLWGALREIPDRSFRREREPDPQPQLAATEAAGKRAITVWLAIASDRNDEGVLRILEQVQASGDGVFDRVRIVDSQGTVTIPRILAERGWSNATSRSYERDLGSSANLRERLRHAAEGGADYAWAVNHDGGFDAGVVQALVKAARSLDDLGAAYPLGRSPASAFTTSPALGSCRCRESSWPPTGARFCHPCAVMVAWPRRDLR
jgi:GT2 family glycosyltransferase